MYGAIEAGGTKFVCGIGTNPDDLKTAVIRTTVPEKTLREAIGFFRDSGIPIRAVGIGSFGPVDLHRDSSTFGRITSTPKPGWRDYDIAGAVAGAMRVPVGFDTDVNAAILGEARWGAAAGLADSMYLTVGTGIGGGAIVNGSVLHGLVHPEMGHIRIPHNYEEDPFPGCCPFHGDCLEGLASGPAIEARWGTVPEQLPRDHKAWDLEAHYIALGLVSWICTLSPKRIILGGGVMSQPLLLNKIRENLAALLGGYIQAGELNEGLNDYIVAAKLGSRAGVIGSLVLAEEAFYRSRPPLAFDVES
ncbi:MAG: ROK family protein [Acidobacteria bacterium]|nr:ROK family protein [Acidobacteriota bacterium]